MPPGAPPTPHWPLAGSWPYAGVEALLCPEGTSLPQGELLLPGGKAHFLLALPRFISGIPNNKDQELCLPF